MRYRLTEDFWNRLSICGVGLFLRMTDQQLERLRPRHAPRAVWWARHRQLIAYVDTGELLGESLCFALVPTALRSVAFVLLGFQSLLVLLGQEDPHRRVRAGEAFGRKAEALRSARRRRQLLVGDGRDV